MKFCPECGYKTDGLDYCPECGCAIKNYGKEEKKEKDKVNDEIKKEIIELYDALDKIDFNDRTFVSLKEIKSFKINPGELNSFYYSSTGGMSGGQNYRTIDFKKKTFETRDKSMHSAPEIVKVYSADDETLNKIKDLIKEMNLPVWSKIPVNTMFVAYDAPNVSTNLVYEHKSFRIDSLIFEDDEELELSKKLRSLVYSLEKEENLISEKTVDGTMFDGPGMTNNNPGFMGMGMSIFPYQNNSAKPNVFCPECGTPKAAGDKNCSCCGYTFK